MGVVFLLLSFVTGWAMIKFYKMNEMGGVFATALETAFFLFMAVKIFKITRQEA